MGEHEEKEDSLPAPAHALPIHPESAPPALQFLFEEHHQRVFRAAYRVTGNAEDAEDALQTVFLRLSRHAELDLRPSPASYLHRAAVNAALDVVRGRASARSVGLEQASELRGPDAHEPDRALAEKELAARLRAAVAALPERAAAMFALRYFEDCDIKQIAKMFGTSKSVVAVTLFRARGEMKRALRGETR